MNDSTGGVIVFGATGSVGQAVVQLLQQNQRPVLAAARNAEKLQALQEKTSVPIFAGPIDQNDGIEQAFAATAVELGTITGVVNCMGTLLLKPTHTTSLEEWEQTLNVNLTSAFLILKSAIPHLRKAGGSVVFVSSAAADMGMSNHEAIAAAKAGLQGLMRAAAATYASKNIRVNTVSPGLVKSQMSEHLWRDDNVAAMSASLNPLGKLGEPSDIARMICWLLDPANHWVTGQNFAIDGGLSRLMQRPRTKIG